MQMDTHPVESSGNIQRYRERKYLGTLFLMKNHKPKTNNSLNNYYNNIHIPFEFLMLLEANKKFKHHYGKRMKKIIQNAEASIYKSVLPN